MLLLFPLVLADPCLPAQTGENVLLVVNRKDALSLQVADYYRPRRSVPAGNVCYLELLQQRRSAGMAATWRRLTIWRSRI
jgi:hypothetical protein